MKGTIAALAPSAEVIDLAHDLPPHGIGESAFVLWSMGRGFPPGTIHVVVVDPGVGSARAAVILACADGSYLVGPDNGVLTPLAQALGGATAYRIDRSKVTDRARVGTTFDGRDLFAPTAARLANGATPRSLGARWPSFEPSPLPRPTRTRSELCGAIVHIDHFGNLITNLPSEWLPGNTPFAAVKLGPGRERTLPVVDHYAALPIGGTGVLRSSFGTVEIARREARAAERWPVRPMQPVSVRLVGAHERQIR